MEEYNQEGRFVQRASLYKRYLEAGNERIDFAMYLREVFPRDVYLQERVGERHGACDRGRCTLVRERRGQEFWTDEFPPRRLRVTGEVYVCADSGAMHVCTPGLCQERFIPPNGHATVCRLTGRVFDDDRLLMSAGGRLGEYHVQASSSGAGYQPDRGNPNMQGPVYNVFDAKAAYRRGAELDSTGLRRYSDQIVAAGKYSERAQHLNDRFLTEAKLVRRDPAALKALCDKYTVLARPHETDEPPFAQHTARILGAGRCAADARYANELFLAQVEREGLTMERKYATRAEALCEQYAELARLRSTWRVQGRAVYRNEVLSSHTAREQLRRGDMAQAEFRKACREYVREQAERGRAVDVRVINTFHLEHKCGLHARIRRRLGDLDRIDAYKAEAEEDVVSLIVDIWTALHDLEATRAKTLEFRDCVLAILGYMAGSYSNFPESLSGDKYGHSGGLRQMVKVEQGSGLAHHLKAGERPPSDRYDVHVVTFVPCVPGLRMGPISSGSIVFDARRARQSTALALSASGPSREAVRPNLRQLDRLVANIKPSEKKKKNAPRDGVPGFAPALNDACTTKRCLDLIIVASKRAGVNAKNIQNVEQRNKSKNMLKCRALASGSGRMTSKKHLHRIVSSLLNGTMRGDELGRFDFAVPERLLALHDKYRLYAAETDEVY